MEKKKISAFEFAIMQAATPEKAKEYEAFTKVEELKMREDSLRKQAGKLKINKNNNL
jgi:hypothetical protein